MNQLNKRLERIEKQFTPRRGMMLFLQQGDNFYRNGETFTESQVQAWASWGPVKVIVGPGDVR